jgi:hypothetical protein
MEKKRMLYNGLKLSDEDADRLYALVGTNPIGNNLCRGCMTYDIDTTGCYFIPATETIEGIRAKIKEFEETGEDPFIRAYEKAPKLNPNLRF